MSPVHTAHRACRSRMCAHTPIATSSLPPRSPFPQPPTRVSPMCISELDGRNEPQIGRGPRSIWGSGLCNISGVGMWNCGLTTNRPSKQVADPGCLHPHLASKPYSRTPCPYPPTQAGSPAGTPNSTSSCTPDMYISLAHHPQPFLHPKSCQVLSTISRHPSQP